MRSEPGSRSSPGGETHRQREVTVGGGHAGGELGPVHFGLGKRDAAEVRVTWPDGDVGPWQEVDADQPSSIEAEEPSATGQRDGHSRGPAG